MRKKLIVLFLLAILTYMFSGCSGRYLKRVDIRKDVKEEIVTRQDPVAEISVSPTSQQIQQKNSVEVKITYLREMNPLDYDCIDKSYDPLEPHLLFEFSMLNTSDEIKYYSPVFVFKGHRGLNLAKEDPCEFFKTYGKINYIKAKPGNKYSLSIQSDSYDQSASVKQWSPKEFTLYPDVPVHGILVVSQEQLDKAIPNVKDVKTSEVNGWAAFFEKVSSNRKPASFRFNYTFRRKDWLEDVKYKKIIPYTYKVNIYQKTTDTIVLGVIKGDVVEDVVPMSERYFEPKFYRIDASNMEENNQEYKIKPEEYISEYTNLSDNDRQIISDLLSTDCKIAKMAVIKIYQEKYFKEEILDVVQKALENYIGCPDLDGESIDTASWCCKALGISKISKYSSILVRISNGDFPSKLKGYAKWSLDQMQ